MALIPVSIIFEILFAVLALILIDRSANLAKVVAVGLWTFEIILIDTVPQQFFSDSTGTLALTTIAFPAAIQGYVTFAVVIVWLYLIYNAYAFITDRKEW